MVYADAATLDAGTLTMRGVAPALLWTADSSPGGKRAGRMRTALWANASLWTADGAWLGSPVAILEGARRGVGAATPVRLSAPAYSPDARTLTLTATPLAADAAAPAGGVVAAALAAARGGGGGAFASAPAGPLPPSGRLDLTDAVLYVDATPPPAPSPANGAVVVKQGAAYYGCAGVPLGTLSSFGNQCGFYSTGYGDQLGGGFASGMLLGSGAYGR